MTVLVSDTSINIDLERGELLESVFQLAVDFAGPDLERPLTARGRRVMKKAALALAARYPKPAVIVSSCAQRARGTADVVARAFGLSTFKETPLLSVIAVQFVAGVLRVPLGILKTGFDAFTGLVTATRTATP